MDLNCEDRMDMEYDLVPMPMYMQMGMPGRATPSMPMMPDMMRMFSMMNEEGFMEMDEARYGEFEDDEIEDIRKKKTYKPSEVNRICRKIERYNPRIFRYMRMYGIPYPAARLLCRRIIRLALMYYDD
ncbi:hypothetical protein [Clostridium sp. ZS2-4]|uniref:hypothetical protein n=1 Tax=Clostridium sp. ZS2-4 TaxID=2987703 RepID=UPI00227B3BDF|nr:hypothetical protein [Clostridium sp. ZS2-4]MCY6354949.1 hypothetical protein [Clostridium sp. ZS2-4]